MYTLDNRLLLLVIRCRYDVLPRYLAQFKQKKHHHRLIREELFFFFFKKNSFWAKLFFASVYPT